MISKYSGPDCITVYQSYEISKHGFDEAIDILCARYPGHAVLRDRSRRSLKNEWAVHNFLYSIDLFCEHTRNTEFNTPLSLKEKLVYSCFGWLCMLLIK